MAVLFWSQAELQQTSHFIILQSATISQSKISSKSAHIAKKISGPRQFIKISVVLDYRSWNPKRNRKSVQAQVLNIRKMFEISVSKISRTNYMNFSDFISYNLICFYCCFIVLFLLLLLLFYCFVTLSISLFPSLSLSGERERNSLSSLSL